MSSGLARATTPSTGQRKRGEEKELKGRWGRKGIREERSEAVGKRDEGWRRKAEGFFECAVRRKLGDSGASGTQAVMTPRQK